MRLAQQNSTTRSTSTQLLVLRILLLVSLGGFSVLVPKSLIASPQPSRIDYLGNFPKHRQSGWSEKLQGVANNDSNWFFTQVNRLWKFPVSHDLNTKVTGPNHSKGIFRTGIPSALNGYDHFGDLDHYRGFLFIPVERPGKTPRIAVFKASSLEYVDSYPLERQRQAGWVAIEPDSGLLYTSNNHIDQDNNPIFIYKFDLQRLQQGDFKLSYHANFYLRNEQGSKIEIKPYLQGGVFSSNGHTLYLVNGKATDFDAKDGGIWAFNANNGRKIMKSGQSGEFKFEFHPGPSKYEEPEGITFWNLDNGRAPRIQGGQVHVILLDNDWASDDEFYFKHYRIH